MNDKNIHNDEKSKVSISFFREPGKVKAGKEMLLEDGLGVANLIVAVDAILKLDGSSRYSGTV